MARPGLQPVCEWWGHGERGRTSERASKLVCIRIRVRYKSVRPYAKSPCVVRLAGYSWLQQAADTRPYHSPPPTHIRARMTSFGLTCDAAPGTSCTSSLVLVVDGEARGAACVCASGDVGGVGRTGGRLSECVRIRIRMRLLTHRPAVSTPLSGR